MRRASAALWLFLGYGVFVVYGSLVPLEYKAIPLDEAWARFQNVPFLNLGLGSRADWVANGVLYAPLAFFGARAAAARGLAQALAAGLASALCCALAVGVEFTQEFFPARTVSLNDIIAECLGSLLGAFAAPFLSGWLDRLAHGWRSGGARLAPRLLELYTASYLLLCFFPYDLLLSAAELRGKAQGGGWGWWLAPSDRGLFLVALQLLVEVALALPIGVLLVRVAPTGSGSLRPLLAGGLLGLVIEGGQFFIESGISQGASVLTRALGVWAGALLWPWLRGAGLPGLRGALRPLALPLLLLYLPLLAAVSGAFKHRWHGLDGALGSWQSTHLLPFYYHYYTSEALALFSLGSVGLMYLPVALLGWARGWRPRWTVGCAALLATWVEAGKLFVDTLHADPTNVIVALAVNAAALGLLAMAHRQSAEEPPSPLAQQRPAPRGSAWLLALPAAAWWALEFPAFPQALLALLVTAAVLVWRWPVLALALVPAALPVLDFAPWSGRLYLDEFDLWLAVCLAVAFHRTQAAEHGSRLRWRTLAFVLLGLSLGCSSLRAIWPLPWPDDNSFASYYSVYNALRIVKGALWAWLFVALWQRLEARAALRGRLFTAGMALGLALTVAAVLWERAVFAGILDFAADFRVTGPFSAMHKGGAYIECYLAVAAAFAMQLVLQARHLAARVAALLLLAGACYAVMVTYSRNGYAALAVVLLLSLLSLAPGLRQRRWQPLAYGALMLVAVLAIALPIAGGSYARERIARSGQDLALRRAHWADGLGLRQDNALTAVIGMGIGRYPETHYWRSPEPVHAGSYRLARDGETRFLRLGQGARLYLDQIVERPQLAGLTLALDLRASKPPVTLEVMLCEKWTLTSLNCVGSAATAQPAAVPGAWQHVELRLDAARLLAHTSPVRAPLKLALLTPMQGAVEVTRLRLHDALGDELLRNGDFAQGMDHWFFATDVDPPWHLHSLPVAVLFDQGWLGVLAWFLLLAGALGSGALLVWRGQAQLPAAWAALAGFAVSGLLNTLIDAPRFLWLLLVLAWLAGAREPAPAGTRAEARPPAPAAAP